jgi:hypothetical protein
MEQLVKQNTEIRLHCYIVSRDEGFKLRNTHNPTTMLLKFSDIHRLDNILETNARKGRPKNRTEISGQTSCRIGWVIVQLTPPSSSALAGGGISVMYGYSPL